MQLIDYYPILLFILLGLGMGCAMWGLGFLLGPRRPDARKEAPYECGFDAFEDARGRFDVRYYLVAIVFILFDLEFAFFFPWAASLSHLNIGFWAMFPFVSILVVMFIYEWRRGALEWE